MNKNTIKYIEAAAFAAGYDEQYNILKEWADKNGYTQNVTGDACKGDQICILIGVFGGSYRKPKLQGFDLLQGVIISDSYGAKKQQHTFTLQLLDGSQKRIKGRNLYRHGTFAKPRKETERQLELDNKHERGSIARDQREERRSSLIY